MIPDADRALASGEQPGSATELLQAILRSQHRQEELLAEIRDSSKPKGRKPKE